MQHILQDMRQYAKYMLRITFFTANTITKIPAKSIRFYRSINGE